MTAIAVLTVRLNDAGAVAVVTADGSLRRGKSVEMKSVLDEAINGLPTIRHVVVARRLGNDVPMQIGCDAWWSDVAACGRDDFAAVELPRALPSATSTSLSILSAASKPRGYLNRW